MSYPYIVMPYPYIVMSYPYIVISYPYIVKPYHYVVKFRIKCSSDHVYMTTNVRPEFVPSRSKTRTTTLSKSVCIQAQK